MEDSYDDEPKRWRSSQKLPFKQISFGLKQIIKDGVPCHLKELHNALELAERSSTSDASSREEISLCRSHIQQALSMLMQDLNSLEDMSSTVRSEDYEKFKEIAGPCCRELHSAIRDAKQVIASLEPQLKYSNVIQNEEVSPSSSSGFGDMDELQQESTYEHERLLIENQILSEELSGLETLTTDIADLRDVMCHLSKHVTEDASKVDTIETNVENTSLEVSTAEKILRQARHLKTAALPTMGATVGFIAGGPIGAVAGIRIGIAASMLGSAVGYFGGKLIQNTNKYVPPVFRPRTSVSVSSMELTEATKSHQS